MTEMCGDRDARVYDYTFHCLNDDKEWKYRH